MGDGEHLIPALVLAALLCPAGQLCIRESPDAQDCGVDEAWIGPYHAWFIQGCDGSSFVGMTLVVPGGRIDFQWERDETAGYSSLALVAPPRFVSWYANEESCQLDVSIAGAMHEECPLAPPGPPPAPWGSLLP